MAFLYVTEYIRQARDSGGNSVPCGEEPPLAAYQIAIGAGTNPGPALNTKTTFLRLHTDAICSVKIGAGTPTAVITEDRMPADATEFRGVDASLVGQSAGVKVAVIANT